MEARNRPTVHSHPFEGEITVMTTAQQQQQQQLGSVFDGHLDAEDLARVTTGFRGQPLAFTPPTGGVRPANAGTSSAYVLDAESGMVYLLD